jgi:cytidylate kinase
MRITICGPAASGKGTIARRFAMEVGIGYVDLGLLFRFGAFALKTEEIVSINQLSSFVQSRAMVYLWKAGVATIHLHNKDVTSLLLGQEIAQATSMLASDASAQDELTAVSNLVLEGFEDVICDGRNAGTTVLPNADYKFYVTAHLEERARRRHLDTLHQGGTDSYEEVLRSIKERDDRDSKREAHPLVIPEGATILETDTRSVEESVLFMREAIGR